MRDENEAKHYTFYLDNPQIFRPESTPIVNDYVNLCVTGENSQGYYTDSVTVKLYKLWFGDYHWHSCICNHATQDYNDVINDTFEDNYLDWMGGCCHDEGATDEEWNNLSNAINYANSNSEPNRFCTLQGYEFSAGRWYRDSKSGHMNIMYKHSNPGLYRCMFREPFDLENPNWDQLFHQFHIHETDGNEWAIAVTHHTTTGECGTNHPNLFNKNPPGTNFKVLFNDLNYPTKVEAVNNRLDHLRGTEILQIRGEQIGGLTEGFTRLYYDDMPDYNLGCLDEAWADWGIFEASQTINKGQQRFGFFGSSDAHWYTHLGSAINSPKHSYAGGITACWAVHDTRDEIFEALNTTKVYASTPLKMRILAKANDKMFGQWNCLETPVKISVSINASSAESEGRAYPYASEDKGADFPHNITDIWIIKNTKDHLTNKTKAKVINHQIFTGKTSNAYYEFVYNGELNPGDYFWIAVDQEEDAIMDNDEDKGKTTELVNKHRAWISPFFVSTVHSDEELAVNSGNDYSGIKTTLLQFYGAANGGLPPYKWHWDFGDGETSDEKNPNHIYENSGDFIAILTVEDSENNIKSSSATVKISENDKTKPDVKFMTLWNYLNHGKTLKSLNLNYISFVLGEMYLVAEASDDFGIDSVEFKINNKLAYSSSSPSFHWRWDRHEFRKIFNIVKVTATDRAGNQNSTFLLVLRLQVFDNY